jgi:hypothetical protein
MSGFAVFDPGFWHMTSASPKTHQEFHQYVLDLSRRSVEDDPRVKALHAAKRIIWTALIAFAFLFFYLLDKMVEALALL